MEENYYNIEEAKFVNNTFKELMKIFKDEVSSSARNRLKNIIEEGIKQGHANRDK